MADAQLSVPTAPKPYDPSLLEAVHSLIAELRHELGNPLNSIKAALTLLRRGVATYPSEKTQSYLDASLNELARLERLLASLRRLSEPAAKEPEPLALHGFLDDFFAQYRYDVERLGIILSIEIAASGSEAAVCPDALSQVLLDLLNGAVRSLSRVEEPRLDITAQSAGPFYVVELRSNGRPREDGPDLSFLSSSIGPRVEDSRLALAISRQILLQRGTAIGVHQASPEARIARLALPLLPEPSAVS